MSDPPTVGLRLPSLVRVLAHEVERPRKVTTLAATGPSEFIMTSRILYLSLCLTLCVAGHAQ